MVLIKFIIISKYLAKTSSWFLATLGPAWKLTDGSTAYNVGKIWALQSTEERQTHGVRMLVTWGGILSKNRNIPRTLQTEQRLMFNLKNDFLQELWASQSNFFSSQKEFWRLKSRVHLHTISSSTKCLRLVYNILQCSLEMSILLTKSIQCDKHVDKETVWLFEGNAHTTLITHFR